MAETHLELLALRVTEHDVDALQRHDVKGGKYPARWADLGPRYNQ